MSFNSCTALSVACATGGSTARDKKPAVLPGPTSTTPAPLSAKTRTCRQSSSNGDRCISGNWYSANELYLDVEYRR